MKNRRDILIGAAALGLASTLPALAAPISPAVRRQIEEDRNAPMLGDPSGDVTLVEFFDYNCGFCRRMMPTVQELIGAEPRLRVIFRELPFMGEGSVFASSASLAALRQGRYWQLHAALMGLRGRADEVSVMRAVGRAGLDEARLRRDMTHASVGTHIERSFEIADAAGIVGTPSFICGDELNFTNPSLADLRALVARARARG